MNDKIVELAKQYGFPSSDKLLQIMKSMNIPVTLKQVRKVLESQQTYQVHKQTSKSVQVESHIVAYWPNEVWQIDLLDMSTLATKNKNFSWILIIVDVFTRQGGAVPIKNKTSATVADALQTVFNKVRAPDTVMSDNGSEFKGEVATLFKKYEVFHEKNEVGYHNALGIIDRFSRTLKNMIYKTMTDNNNLIWHDKLQQLVTAYNETPHSGIMGIQPSEAYEFNNFYNIYHLNLEKNIVNNAKRYKVGDTVRVRVFKNEFSKGYEQAWTNTTYKIKEISGVNAILSDGQQKKLNDLLVVSEKSNNVTAAPAIVAAKKAKRSMRANMQAHVDPTNVIRSTRSKKDSTVINSPFIPREILEYDAETDRYLVWFLGYSRRAASWESPAKMQRYAGWNALLQRYNNRT